MTCKDCIHEKICGYYAEFKDDAGDCKHFKNKADFVEVVRCEKCKDFEPHGNGKAGICRNRKLKPCLRHDTDFCSYGERK